MCYRYFALGAIAALPAFLFSPAAHADGFKRIQTEAEYRELVVGKRWHAGDGYVVAKPNGGLAGEFGGTKLKGAWAWRGDMFCRTLQTHRVGTECQVVKINGNQMQIIQQRGKGKTQTFTAK
ncbi:hypothetical protein ACUXV3_00860 [Roseobacteraceae bacterium NS-SX3]